MEAFTLAAVVLDVEGGLLVGGEAHFWEVAMNKVEVEVEVEKQAREIPVQGLMSGEDALSSDQS